MPTLPAHGQHPVCTLSGSIDSARLDLIHAIAIMPTDSPELPEQSVPEFFT
jgi:hypothetical protein